MALFRRRLLPLLIPLFWIFAFRIEDQAEGFPTIRQNAALRVRFAKLAGQTKTSPTREQIIKQHHGLVAEEISRGCGAHTSSRVSAVSRTTALRLTVSSDDSSIIQQPDGTDTMDSHDMRTLFSWKKQWYPVMPISYLNDLDPRKPVSVRILGYNLVVWKSSTAETAEATTTNQWSVFEDTCPHRKSPLSTGQVVAGCLTCRYHGWEFGADGRVEKLPMQLPSDPNIDSVMKIKANCFPTQAAGGLLWVFLEKIATHSTPKLPPDAVASEDETAQADWIFNRNPISYTSMVENSFDPAHAPWTHEQMSGLGMSFSSTDAIPMQHYDVREPPTIRGFALEHSPYQNSTARMAGPDSRTIRTFVPPCTVSVASPPFFETKLWFVPANRYETNVLSFLTTPNTRWVKWTRRFPRLREFVKDTQHTFKYMDDWSYRFLAQDRITMQGQDMRKAGTKSLKDLSPNISDKGVATIQHWLQTFGRGGPFAAVPTLGNAVNPDSLTRELSFWESHGKYCPRCQRTMSRVSSIEKWATTWSNRLVCATTISAMFIIGGTGRMITSTASHTSSITSLLLMTRVASTITINLLVAMMGLMRLTDWCCRKQTRMHTVSADHWHLSVFGYRSKPREAVK